VMIENSYIATTIYLYFNVSFPGGKATPTV
jgi:hypothetical protein